MITTNTTSLKYTIDTPENRQFLSEIRDTLFSFGRQFPSPGGGSYYLGDDGTPLKDRPRETWITSRMAHVYSIASLLEPASDYGLLADALCRDCVENCMIAPTVAGMPDYKRMALLCQPNNAMHMLLSSWQPVPAF